MFHRNKNPPFGVTKLQLNGSEILVVGLNVTEDKLLLEFEKKGTTSDARNIYVELLSIKVSIRLIHAKITGNAFKFTYVLIHANQKTLSTLML
jgi:hypothetical protein